MPLRDHRRPPITKFEHLAALKALRERGRQAIDEQALFDMVAEQRRLVAEAIDRTTIARKSAQRVAYALDIGRPALVGPAKPMTVLYEHLFAPYRERAQNSDAARIDCCAAIAG